MGSRSPSGPAVPLTIAFLVGIELAGRTAATPAVWAGLAVAAAWLTLLIGHRWPTFQRILGCLALAGLGGCRLAADRTAAEGRRAALLALAGRPGLHFVGRVLTVPEIERDGERVLDVRGRPEHGVRAGSVPELTLRLRVRRSTADATPRLDGLRHGDRVRVWCRVYLPRVGGHPDAVDPALSLWARGLDGYATVKSPLLIEPLGSGPAGVRRAIDRLRAAARRRAERVFGGDPRTLGVLRAMVLGERLGLGEAEVRLFQGSGLVHLLAISGLHAAVVASIVVGSLRRAGLGPRAVAIVAGAALLVLAILVGAQPPVLRAVITAGLALAGRSIGREGQALNYLAISALVLALGNPWLMWAPSFQLSFLAVAGILLSARALASTVPLPRWIRGPVGVSAAAYLATAPVLAWHFGRLAPVAIGANLLAVPLCGPIVLGGILSLLFAGVPLVGNLTATLTDACVRGVLGVGEAAASLPGAWLRVSRPDALVLAAYAVLGLWWLARTYEVRDRGQPSPPRRPGAPRAVLTAGFGCCVAFLHLDVPAPLRDLSQQLLVLDVGQGQAVVLRGSLGGCVAIDAGGGDRFDAGERVVLPALGRLGCRRLEVLALSHEHADHVGGAVAVLRSLEVSELWIPPGSGPGSSLRELAALARSRGSAVVLARRGHRARRGGIEMEVLHPGPVDVDLSVNDRSMVLRARVAPHAQALIPGDLGGRGELALLEASRDIAAEALVVGHHGAGEGTTAQWLDAVSPRLAVISVGTGNRFGHPDPGVIARLSRHGVAVYRTDLDGTVALRAEVAGWSAATFRRSEREREPGHGYERRQEHQREGERHHPPSGAKAPGLVEQTGVTVPHPQQDDPPQRVQGWLPEQQRLCGHEQQQHDQRQAGQRSMDRPRQCVGDVAAVELSHGKQVHRSEEHSEPAGQVELIHAQGRCSRKIEQRDQDRAQDRLAADHEAAVELLDGRGGAHETDHEQREGHGVSGQRPGRGDVEQSRAVRDHSADPDHGPERAERRRTRQEERRGRWDPVVPAGEIVTHLVGR
jgi:competence protein ComEC